MLKSDSGDRMSGGLDAGKQAKELAEAANVAVDAVAELGGFVDSAFGKAISNGIGLLADKLAYYRLEKAIELQLRVEEKLKKNGVKKRRFIPVAFGLPILENATVEEDETLKDKWANLLANALDPNFKVPLRRNYTSILRYLEPIDARLLDRLVGKLIPFDHYKSALLSKVLISRDYGLSIEECGNAVRNLIRLGLFKPGVVMEEAHVTGINYMGNHAIASYKDTEMFAVTPMGVDFYKAVST